MFILGLTAGSLTSRILFFFVACMAPLFITGCQDEAAPEQEAVRRLPAGENPFENISIPKEEPPAPPPPPKPLPAELRVSPPVLDFGERFLVDGPGRIVATIANVGGEPMAINDVAVAGNGAFSLESAGCGPKGGMPMLSPNGGFCKVTVAFAPKEKGTPTGRLLIVKPDGVAEVALRGLATEPAPPPPPAGPTALERAAAEINARRRRAGASITAPTPVSPDMLTEREYEMQDPNYKRIGLDPDYLTYPVNRERVLTEDRYIPALLENAINSQRPGRVIAVVERHVYGSDGRRVLIPAGSRIVGTYESLAKVGDTRLTVVWERILRPDGASILMEFEGADQMGRTGLVGVVDNRWWEKYGTAVLISTLSAASAFAVPAENEQFAVAQADLSQNMAQITARTIEENINLEPVMSVAKGSRILVIPTTDLWFREPTVNERQVQATHGRILDAVVGRMPAG